jgi:hypothetical protein
MGVWDRSLLKLTKWAKERGIKHIDLNYDGESYITWVLNTINEPYEIGIEKWCTNEVKVYFFLHELGHHIIRTNLEYYQERYPLMVKAELSEGRAKGNLLRRNAYKVAEIGEEFEAWDEARLLATRLKIRINEKNFETLRVKSLMTYIRFYGKH